MEQVEVLRRIITILDMHTSRVENNVRYGNYPFITEYNGNIRVFKFQEIEEVISSLTGWLLPVGIPFVLKYDANVADGVDRSRTIGYFMGNSLYINEVLFERFMQGPEEKVLYTPVLENFIYVAPDGWSLPEQKSFGKYLWQLTTKMMSGDFREVTDINFEAPMDMNQEILFMDGWVVNRLAGKNVFFGITKCAIEQFIGIDEENIDVGNKHLWYNKYLVVLDVNGGNGIQVFSRMRQGSSYHPHVSSGGNLCRGNAARRIQDKLNTGQITEFFVFMKDFLMSYSNENPFFHLPVSNSAKLNGSKYIIDKIYINGDDDGDGD